MAGDKNVDALLPHLFFSLYQMFLEMCNQKDTAGKLIMPICSIFMLTFTKLSHKRSAQYRKSKMINLIKKSRKSRTNKRTLFILPKFAIIIYIAMWLERPNLSIQNFYIPESTSNVFLDTEYLAFCNNTITDRVNE